MATPASKPSAEETLHWLALHLIPGLGARKAVPLVRKFRSPMAVFQASRSELIAEGLPAPVAQTIVSGVTFEEAAGQSRSVESHGVSVIPFQNPDYPALLSQIHDPPLLLFARGRAELLNRPVVAIVGTRRPTPYGLAATERLASELAGTGLVIVSGMARGIDSAAHKAVLAAGGLTVAVFGSGMDHIYPAENRRLSEEMAVKGCLITEYPMGAPGHPQNFPVRNRIIAGMSLGVMVVEGAQYSGSAITAQLAMDFGRDVFAVPGNITSKMSWGPNLLIKQGARLIQAAEDVLSELPLEARRSLRPLSPDSLESPWAGIEQQLGPMASIGQKILGFLDPARGTHIDTLLENLENCSSSEVVATLFQLQLLGAVRELPGRNFVTVWLDRPPAAGE